MERISVYHLYLKINSLADNFKEGYLNYWDMHLLYYHCFHTNSFIGNFYFSFEQQLPFFESSTFACSDQIFDRLVLIG